MKKFIFVFIIFFNLNSFDSFSKEFTKIIYIDNSKNYLKKEVIIKQLDSIVKESSDFLIFISNGNDPIVINNLDEYNKEINSLLSKRTPRPNLKVDIRLLNDLFSEKISNFIHLDKRPSKKISFYFLMDLTNFNRYDYINNLVDKILVLYKIKTLDGIDDCCNVNSFIFIHDSEKKMSDQNKLRKYINYKYY